MVACSGTTAARRTPWSSAATDRSSRCSRRPAATSCRSWTWPSHHAGAAGRPLRTVALLHGARGTFPQAVIGGARPTLQRLGLEIVLDEPYPRRSRPTSPRSSPAWRAPARPDPRRRHHRGRPGVRRRATPPAHPAVPRRAGRGADRAVPRGARPGRRRLLRPEPVGADAPGPAGPRPDLRAVQRRFRARFGLEPDYPAAQAYAAGLVAARCAEIAGSLEDDRLWQAAGRLDLTTFYGRFRLDPQTGQQVGHEMVVAQWQAGQKQIVWPAGRRHGAASGRVALAPGADRRPDRPAVRRQRPCS